MANMSLGLVELLASRAIGIGQILQKLSRRDQIGGVETLGEAVVDRLEAGDGLRQADHSFW